MAQLISIQVGKPAMHPPVEVGGKQWRSGILKHGVDGPLWLGREGLQGDGQADLRNHGGPERAANLYPAEHYDYWRLTPGLEAMTGGAFGENFTTLGLLETTTCVGDVFRVGEALVEVSQPRGPCYKLDRRWGVPDLSQRAEQELRFGWYFRVRQEGSIQAPAPLTLLEHPYPQWTVALVWQVMTGPWQPELARELAGCPALSRHWQAALLKKLDHPGGA